MHCSCWVFTHAARLARSARSFLNSAASDRHPQSVRRMICAYIAAFGFHAHVFPRFVFRPHMYAQVTSEEEIRLRPAQFLNIFNACENFNCHRAAPAKFREFRSRFAKWRFTYKRANCGVLPRRFGNGIDDELHSWNARTARDAAGLFLYADELHAARAPRGNRRRRLCPAACPSPRAPGTVAFPLI